MSPHWSNVSMIFYIILALYTYWTFYQVKILGNGDCKRVPVFNRYYVVLWLILTVVAVFRYIDFFGMGGTDAHNYIYLFWHCNDPSWQDWSWLNHTDIGFRYIAKFIRYFVSDYHIYFFFIYGFMVFAMILFLHDYMPKKSILIPCVLIIFLYWRSFNTIRSGFAISVILLALVLLRRKHYYWCLVVALLSLTIHKMAFVYFLFFPFYWFFKDRKIKIWHIALLLVIIIFFSRVFQSYFILEFAYEDLGGAYVSYARKSIGVSFLENFWKIAFEQLLLCFFLLKFNFLAKYKEGLNEEERQDIQLLWLMVVFDMLMIPVCFILNVWRGYEVFYLPRIVMWCIFLYSLKIQPKYKMIPTLLILFIFLSWLVFRFYNMWEGSNLMPYVFEPFQSLL